jgi:hypothetical protein
MNWLDRQGPATWGILAAVASAVVTIASAVVNAGK